MPVAVASVQTPAGVALAGKTRRGGAHHHRTPGPFAGPLRPEVTLGGCRRIGCRAWQKPSTGTTGGWCFRSHLAETRKEAFEDAPKSAPDATCGNTPKGQTGERKSLRDRWKKS